MKEFPDISDDELFKALGRVRRLSDIGDGEAHGLIARRNRAVGESCRRDDFINCANLIVAGLTVDGGSAEMMIAEARALASIPDDLERITEAHGGGLLATANVPRRTAFQVTLHATGVILVQSTYFLLLIATAEQRPVIGSRATCPMACLTAESDR